MHSGKCFIIISLDMNHVECHHSIPICLVTNLGLKIATHLAPALVNFASFRSG